MIELALIKQCLKNDRRAQFELYKQCYGILLSVCRRYEKNQLDAEALLNQAFMKILTNLKKYNQKVPFEAWIRRIAINNAVDEYRKNKKRNVKEQNTSFDSADVKHLTAKVQFNKGELDLDAEVLVKVINTLPPVSKQVFNLHVIDGYSHDEIADMLGISTGTTKWHVSNARKILKEKIIKLRDLPATMIKELSELEIDVTNDR